MAVIKQITLVLPVSKLMAMIVKLSPKYRREFYHVRLDIHDSPVDRFGGDVHVFEVGTEMLITNAKVKTPKRKKSNS